MAVILRVFSVTLSAISSEVTCILGVTCGSGHFIFVSFSRIFAELQMMVVYLGQEFVFSSAIMVSVMGTAAIVRRQNGKVRLR